MSEVSSLSDAEQQFLQPYLPSSAKGSTQSPNLSTQSGKQDGTGMQQGPQRAGELPFVTLTYASSLDGMISLAPGTRTTLSGPETKSMTHYLRLHHDAILVGVGTAIADDPSLNCRYPGATFEDQPTPVIIDPQLRLNATKTKAYALAQAGQGKAVTVVTTITHGRLQALDSRKLMFLRSDDSSLPHHASWHSILKGLKSRGINSVMIEGGASVISSLLATPELINSVIITIAPTWLGRGGVDIAPEAVSRQGVRDNAARLHGTSWRQFGQDAVLCGFLQPNQTET